MEKSIYSSQQRKLRKLLRQVRSGAGMRQVDLAASLGKHQTFVSNYERGARTLDLLELRQVCRVVGVSLVDFVRRFEESIS